MVAQTEIKSQNTVEIFSKEIFTSLQGYDIWFVKVSLYLIHLCKFYLSEIMAYFSWIPKAVLPIRLNWCPDQ